MILEYIAGTTWRVTQEITFRTITVPVGFESDLTSIPRLLYPLFLPYGKYLRAAIIHDYLYATGKYSKSRSDRIFLQIMQEDNVSWFVRHLFHLAVYIFGQYKPYLTN